MRGETLSIPSLILLSVALAMDAFAAAVCIGVTLPKFKLQSAITVGLYFGVFQAAMPLIGYVIGDVFAERVTSYDHYIVFALLLFLGGKMIYESRKGDDTCEAQASLGVAVMVSLALATSIDALAAGVSFAFSRVNILLAITLIGVITFTISAIGVKIGSVVGCKFKSKAEFAGGAILIILAIRALVQGI
jgi:putative Mn2+ efflux pump MntP